LRRWTSFELGQAVERRVVVDARDSQRDRLRRWVGGRRVLAPEEGGSRPLFEISSVVPQHLFSESRMHYEPGAIGAPAAAPARQRAIVGTAGTVKRSRASSWVCRDISILLHDCRSRAAGLRGAKPTSLQESDAVVVSSGSARVPAARQCPYGAVESARVWAPWQSEIATKGYKRRFELDELPRFFALGCGGLECILDVDRLRVFREAATLGSFTAAARKLSFTQPGVSHHVKQLERELGVTLHERSPRGIRLTPPGRALLAHADAVLLRLADAERDTIEVAREGGGRLSLASFPTGAATVVPPAVGDFRRKHSGVRLELAEADPPVSLPRLAAGEVDLVVAYD
jgi:hypothetical protein